MTRATFDTLLYDVRNGVAWIELNRPQVLNAMNGALVAEMARALESAGADDAVRAVVIAGAGRAFSTGGDLKAGETLRAEFGLEAPVDLFLVPLQAVLAQLRALPKPVIAAVQGHCLAGGLELLLCCDLVIASDDAQFGDPRAARGLLPALGGVNGLMRAVGVFKAREMLFTARICGAAEMERAGLVGRVCAAATLRAEAQAMGEGFAAMDPATIATLKRMCHDEIDMSWDQAARHELALNRVHLASSDAPARGLAAFRRRRAGDA